MNRIILLLKSHVAGYTRRDGTYVKPHNRKDGAHPGEGQLALFLVPPKEAKPSSQADSAAKSGRMSYAKTVEANLKHMDTPRDDWSAVGVTGMAEAESDNGARMMPEFDMPRDYAQAPSLFHGQDHCCHLCGTDIKNVYWIKNDKKKWIMPVGSECVTHFNEGESGEKLAKRTVQEQNRGLLSDTAKARSALWNAYKVQSHRGYGRTETAIPYSGPSAKAYEVHQKLKKLIGTMHSVDSSDAAITRWVAKNKDAAAELIKEANELVDKKRALTEPAPKPVQRVDPALDPERIARMAAGARRQHEHEERMRAKFAPEHERRYQQALEREPQWEQIEGIEVLRSPGSDYAAFPITGKRSSRVWQVFSVKMRKPITQLRKDEVRKWLARRDSD